MIPSPIALGLTICERVIVEQGTRSLSLIGTFDELSGTSFPLVPPPFYAYAVLTGGQGDAELELIISDVETDDETSRIPSNVSFPDRFAEVHIIFRLPDCSFPRPGSYLFTLLVDG